MDAGLKKIIDAGVTAGIIGLLGATIRALLTNESPMQKVRTFVAGVVMSVLVGVILRDAAMSEMWKEIIVGACGAFVSSFWPVLEAGVKKIVKRKTDAVANNNLP